MRLIDADALLINAEQYRCGRGEYSRMVDVWHIEHAPTIEAEPVRHGRWLVDARTGMSFCSDCNCYAVEADTKYCPECGCKMDGGE